jgi:hypothetical protein
LLTTPVTITQINTTGVGGQMILQATGQCEIRNSNVVTVSIEDASNAMVADGSRRPTLIGVPPIAYSTFNESFYLSFATTRADVPSGPKTYFLNFRSHLENYARCTGQLTATWTPSTVP